MTLIAAFTNKDFSVIVADRRRTQLTSKERIDDVRKIHQISDHIAVGFAGIYLPISGINGVFKGIAESIINDCAYLIDKETRIEDVAEIYSRDLLSKLESGMPKEDIEVTFHIVGLDRSGNYSLARVSCFEDFEPVITPSPDKGITWGLSRADYSPTKWLEARIAELSEVSVKSIQELAIKLVEHTAERDGYVSGTYDMLTLTRER